MNVNHQHISETQNSNNIEHLNDHNNIDHFNNHNNTVLLYGYEFNYLFNFFMIILSVVLCLNFCKAVKNHNLYIDYQRNQIELNNQNNQSNNTPNYTIIQNKIIKIKEYKINNASEEICSICLETYKKNDIINILKCGHKYHDKCIDGWIETSHNCPLCRLSI